MFGYITLSGENLTQDRQDRYRAYYCGLCESLKAQYGQISRFTLSYDLTFLYILLSSLYEPEEETAMKRCAPHMLKPHVSLRNETAEYCCDMNILLSYYKVLDDWNDEKKPSAWLEKQLLQNAFEKASHRWPQQSKQIKRALDEITVMENNSEYSPDRGANATGELLKAVYHFREDEWTRDIEKIGESLGRFIYIMDAYEDLPEDIRRNRFNPLVDMSKENGFEETVREALTMFMAEAAESFEMLPLVKDVDILRNILYSGCWTRYHFLAEQKSKKTAVLEKQNLNATRR